MAKNINAKCFKERSISMWTEIRDKGYTDKYDVDISRKIANCCYVCEYVRHKFSKIDCDRCPVNWSSIKYEGGDTPCEEKDSPYFRWLLLANAINYCKYNYKDSKYSQEIYRKNKDRLYKYADEVLQTIKGW